MTNQVRHICKVSIPTGTFGWSHFYAWYTEAHIWNNRRKRGAVIRILHRDTTQKEYLDFVEAFSRLTGNQQYTTFGD